MAVINIREAQRSGARVVIGLAGQSGSGKTLTALYLAWGMAGYDSKKVGFLDTENKRGSLYADALKDAKGNIHRFLIGDLYPPFSPQRYIDAIREFEKAGVEVLVIDSATHEWEGEGGCEDIANAGDPRMPKWNKAKAEHKRFVNAALQCDMHLIVCIRAREKVKVSKEKNAQGKIETLIESIGVQPICEKNFMFEMTASALMLSGGKSREVLKCPAELESVFGQTGTIADGYLTPQHGKALRDWVDGATGERSDPKLEKWANSLRGQTEQGSAHFEQCWQQTPEKIRKALGDTFYAELTEAAKAYDQMRQQAGDDPDAQAAVDGLNSAISGAANDNSRSDTEQIHNQ